MVETAVQPDVIVEVTPALDQHLGFLEYVNDSTIQQLITKLVIVRFLVMGTSNNPHF